eukprot:gnl/TRDRNA2_/TRDRNA2_136496_c0_seq1.p3 gnl/TRDRNA2_/TRDRNA2_136496_c0~~gnl/TRDRNA2_/TRDRNA2_136496_c0_seq1.p3  ORF type:complete len:116 (-),score=24.83 gnl/TRDRNA2_/TRDRNA2_136496_c0_seq1:23-370(-)
MGDVKAAGYWARKAAASGFPEAQHMLATMLRYGGGQVKGDVAEAMPLFAKAAKKGIAAAQYNYNVELGRLGRFSEATTFLRRAAAQGHPKAVEVLQQMQADGVLNELDMDRRGRR